MLKKIKYLVLMLAVLLVACDAGGPKSTLDDMAKAMENNNPSQFMANFDMNAYAANYISQLTNEDQALGAINAITGMLGLGNVDQLLGNIIDFQRRLTLKFERGVASGELMAECGQTTSPECPWVPQSLRNAKIRQIDDNAAIASVTTPQKLTSWLALRKKGDKWLVVGQAVLESQAKKYATTVQPGASTPAPQSGQRGSSGAEQTI